MATVAVRRRVRPLRFAFLVDPANAEDVRAAMQVCTILWGGLFNPIVPIRKRIPSSWGVNASASEVVRGYLDAFDPDWFVVGSVDASRFQIPTDRTVPLSEMLSWPGLNANGLHVLDLYRWFYEKEFRFVKHEPTTLRIPEPEGPSLRLFTSAVFGEFPGSPLETFARSFEQMGAKPESVTASSYVEVLRNFDAPIRMAIKGIRDFSPVGPRRSFLLLDPSNPSDLLDFWNLRACGWRTIAVPVGWADALAPTIAKTIAAEHRPERALRRHVTEACLMKTRGVSERAFATFAEAVGGAPDSVNVLASPPAIWARTRYRNQPFARIEVSAVEEDFEARIEHERIAFRTLGPEFDTRSFWREGPRFVNVIELSSYDRADLAAVIPRSTRDLGSILESSDCRRVRACSEGIALETAEAGRQIHWRLPKGLDIMSAFLGTPGGVALSGAGRIADRLLAVLHGPDGASLVADPEIVKLIATANDGAAGDVSVDSVFGTLLRVTKNNRDRARGWLKALLDRGVFRLGLRLQCDGCGQKNWFALEALRPSLTCEKCLGEIHFPVADPPKKAWHYRPAGPFAVKDHAQGTFVVANAIRVLRNVGPARTTWVPSCSVSVGGEPYEFDFSILWQHSVRTEAAPDLVFGECKTFDLFRTKDVARMRALGAAFPRSVIVFATLRDRLEPGERKSIGRLARAGRRRGWTNPVIVLTRRELAADFAPPYCWYHGGSELERRLGKESIAALGGTMRRVADASQQLHLDMPADAGWPHREDD